MARAVPQAAVTIVPETDGTYTALCDKHVYWSRNAPTEVVARSLYRRHAQLWRCEDPDTLDHAVAKMRQKSGIQVLP